MTSTIMQSLNFITFIAYEKITKLKFLGYASQLTPIIFHVGKKLIKINTHNSHTIKEAFALCHYRGALS